MRRNKKGFLPLFYQENTGTLDEAVLCYGGDGRTRALRQPVVSLWNSLPQDVAEGKGFKRERERPIDSCWEIYLR